MDASLTRMKVTPLRLAGLASITPEVHGDSRGYFMEVFNKDTFTDAGLPFDVVEHNQSHSQKNVLRGLHFQYDPPLSKIVRVVRGKAFFVAVDTRKESQPVGGWEARELSPETKELFFIPAGFATGFCALEDDTDIEYYFNNHYNPRGETNIAWNDHLINISWPIENPILSERDAGAQSLKDWLAR